MSAAEDYEAFRAARRQRAAEHIPERRTVITTKCLGCGAVIPFGADTRLMCDKCWGEMNGR